jgi:hypothetical protein
MMRIFSSIVLDLSNSIIGSIQNFGYFLRLVGLALSGSQPPLA